MGIYRNKSFEMVRRLLLHGINIRIMAHHYYIIPKNGEVKN